ncbi:ElyC/SanA/YdcF family protein [Marinospirillum insulare]|uniref:Membrane protein n=1 Tax=Marinospirillum insulare TaxID=217169 RepID=A0ABQ5ZW93_9GAMM|nr:ElyC/SanA/YdcF family protein [Marinospirillum insulare]GLR63593.1 membrane protein [Marinospirillum insulare]
MQLGFYLKKMLGMMLMPIPLTLLLLVAGLITWQRVPKLSRGLIIVAGILLALTSWQPASDELIRPFEEDYPQFNLDQPVAAVVVLGGCHSTDKQMPPAAQLCSSSLFRLIEGLRILQANPQAKLLVSGYASSDIRPHAEVMLEVALSMGVAEDRVLVYPTPRDTQEEAVVMCSELYGKSFALVTENSHLPRAMRFFEEQQLTPIAAPALKMSANKSDWRINAHAALKSERAAYEFWGSLWQRFK